MATAAYTKDLLCPIFPQQVEAEKKIGDIVSSGRRDGCSTRMTSGPRIIDMNIALMAAEYGHTAMVKTTARQECRCESEDESGGTPLLWAALQAAGDDCNAVVKLLLDKNADVKSKNESSRTPFIHRLLRMAVNRW